MTKATGSLTKTLHIHKRDREEGKKGKNIRGKRSRVIERSSSVNILR